MGKTDGSDLSAEVGEKMLFNSLNFAVFLPIVFLLYWAIPNRKRWLLLLISSYYFYMSWNAKYVFLILGMTAISYICGIGIERAKKKSLKKWILVGTTILCLGILFLFKYYNFSIAIISNIGEMIAIPLHPVTLKLILPVGISFYTFQIIGYIVDVYRGGVFAERHFGKYAAFISFFPQLVAGPIERSRNLLPRMSSMHTFCYDKAAEGLKRMAWGYFKKIVVADRLAIYVDAIYGNVVNYSGFSLIIATLFFTVQIYCDFSGYTDIAIGTAKLMDIDLMENFKSPYLATSFKDFWRRWHISLSSWFRDYLYIPLGGNKFGPLRRDFNTIITFLMSGLWHGADSTYLVWGGLHGIAQVAEKHFCGKRKHMNGWKVFRGIKITFVFLFCCFAWIFFRAETIGDACYIIKNITAGIDSPIAYIKDGLLALGLVDSSEIVRISCLLFVLFIFDLISLKINIFVEIASIPLVLRWFLYILLGLAIILLSQKGMATEFVYFQF